MPIELELALGRALLAHPARFKYRYNENAKRDLLRLCFQSLTGFNNDYMNVLFPDGPEKSNWNLSEAQGAKEGAEYSEGARGKRCGHVFKAGEASYRCMTCTTDDTCVLCARCFNASDHDGHKYTVHVSSGHSGCCDCGDHEAFRLPVNCAIHTDLEGDANKGKVSSRIPPDLSASIRSTVARVFDYFCDVISCSPEQLRLPKTEDNIRQDEVVSRLSSEWYGGADPEEESPEFSLILWNDEKHTILEVTQQVIRACRESQKFASDKSNETHEVGRSVIKYSKDLPDLLRVSRVIEQIRITTTIRSSRDTYREQMCGTILEWFSDIACCYIGNNSDVLRRTLCEEMLNLWRPGSRASNLDIGMHGIDDHSREEGKLYQTLINFDMRQQIENELLLRAGDLGGEDRDEDENEGDMDDEAELEDVDDEDENDDDDDDDDEDDDGMDDISGHDFEDDSDVDMDIEDDSDAAYAIPFSPPNTRTQEEEDLASDIAHRLINPNGPDHTQTGVSEATRENESADAGEASRAQIRTRDPTSVGVVIIPKTPGLTRQAIKAKGMPYWEVKPSRYRERSDHPYENIRRRTRLDWLILYDLRLWKKARTDARELCLGTVINVPDFKRILGLRFAALYTALAQLYLVADREPDHSIINLSLQILTTPSITEEIVQRANFFTNIMAILYTFLTTRQVGEAHDVNPSVTLTMDSASITNRRLFHFFFDLRYLLSSPYVQTRIRLESQYLLQFLDLVKLPQGICPNTRAVGEHVEYEPDSWISASLLMREINRLCRLFCDAFQPHKLKGDHTQLARAIIAAALATIVNCFKLESRQETEADGRIHFKHVPQFAFETDSYDKLTRHKVVDFVVERGSMSFHHPLHYTLSWLLECGRTVEPDSIRDLLSRAAMLAKHNFLDGPSQQLDGEDILLVMFDYPLRVCAWLAQLKAGMWVRNGLSLRHQMNQYRSTSSRDVAYYRNIFMVQAAMVICGPSRFLATIADRYGFLDWVKNKFSTRPGYDEPQHIDIAEEFIHLLIIIISERSALVPVEDETKLQRDNIKKDIAHALCFKPLSYSELLGRISEKITEMDDFQDVLAEVATFREPGGLNDTGMFEMKQECINCIDPYAAHYSKNQRDEAENLYKQWTASKTKKKPADIVFEPELKPIPKGLFKGLTIFTQTPLFAQIIHECLEYCLMFKMCTPEITASRVESLLHMVLHLLLLAIMEDAGIEHSASDRVADSVVSHALCRVKATQLGDLTIVGLLQHVSNVPDFESCGPKIRRILQRLWLKRPKAYSAATEHLKFPYGKIDSDSSATAVDAEAELKRKRLERQAKIMAQFQQQQEKFLNNAGNLDWGEDLSADEATEPVPAEKKIWKYPTGNCILCQEETNDSKLYGAFALMTDSALFRQTELKDPSYVKEALNCPSSLDQSADGIRPYGVASENRISVKRFGSAGQEVISEKQGLGKGFPPSHTVQSPITTGCGHIMHYACFDAYCNSTCRRHGHQVARDHPERLELLEFLCPLCKALGNVFLPIIWKGKEESYPSVLSVTEDFDDFLAGTFVYAVARFRSHALIVESDKLHASGYRTFFLDYITKNITSPLSTKIEQSVTPTFPSSTFGSSAARLPMPGLYPAGESSSTLSAQQASASAPADPAVTELVAVYRRLRRSMHANVIPSWASYRFDARNVDDLVYSGTLIKCFGSTIAAVEIAQRGVACETGTTLLNTIPQITLTHLRILSETVLCYCAVGGLRDTSSNTSPVHEFREMHRRQLCQLFLGHRSIAGLASLASENRTIEPLFSLDTFGFLAECSLSLVPVLGIELLHIIHICYVAEIIKTVLGFILQPEGLLKEISNQRIDDDLTPEQILSTRSLVSWITATYRASAPHVDPILAPGKSLLTVTDPPEFLLKAIRRLATKYALPFLRKVVILLHAQHGVDFPHDGTEFVRTPELDRLARLLRLPSIDEIFKSFTGYSARNPFEALANGWIAHWNTSRRESKLGSKHPMFLSLPHPGIFELVGLPKFYDTLFDEANQRRCPTSKKELTDPSICLFCGDIFCAQAVCCMDKSKLGGCNRHVEKCGKNVGVFLNIRKCAILYLHNRHGCWQYAPYLDAHGEADMGFRHHRPLILNQKRYDRLIRDVWLTHGIPAIVSRKLESEINNGGWETQ